MALATRDVRLGFVCVDAPRHQPWTTLLVVGLLTRLAVAWHVVTVYGHNNARRIVDTGWSRVVRSAEQAQERSMPHANPPAAHLRAVQYALEQEVPGRVQRSWWDEDLMAHVFEVADETVVHQVAISAAFCADCPDYAAGLRDSELADHLRETRGEGRRFIVRWQGDAVRLSLTRR